MSDVWSRRLRRAEQLEKEWPFAREVLAFYKEIVSFQSKVAAARPTDTTDLLRFVPLLLDVMQRVGTPDLAAAAAKLRCTPGDEWTQLFESVRSGSPPQDLPPHLFARILAQPVVQLSIERFGKPTSRMLKDKNNCPFRHPPLVSILREDKQAEAVRRALVCSLCIFEWDFPRVLCPACQEESPEKLPRFTAEEIPWIRVDACDSCKKYIKSVDLTKNPDADPIVDELASTPLDVIAHERGYAKIAPNLLGL